MSPCRSCSDAAASHGLTKRWMRSKLDRPAGRAQLGEHAAAADGLELMRVADEHEPPCVLSGELHQPVQIVRAEHAGLVDDHRGARTELPPVARRTIGSRPFVEQLGDRVRHHPGLVLQHPRRLRRRGEAEHGSVRRRVQRGDGGVQHCRLAGSGRADNQGERVVAGDGRCGLVLDHVEVAALDGGRGLRVERRCFGGPVEDLLFLGEHGLAGDM